MELKIRDDAKFKPPAIMLVGGLVYVMLGIDEIPPSVGMTVWWLKRN